MAGPGSHSPQLFFLFLFPFSHSSILRTILALGTKRDTRQLTCNSLVRGFPVDDHSAKEGTLRSPATSSKTIASIISSEDCFLSKWEKERVNEAINFTEEVQSPETRRTLRHGDTGVASWLRMSRGRERPAGEAGHFLLLPWQRFFFCLGRVLPLSHCLASVDVTVWRSLPDVWIKNLLNPGSRLVVPSHKEPTVKISMQLCLPKFFLPLSCNSVVYGMPRDIYLWLKGLTAGLESWFRG